MVGDLHGEIRISCSAATCDQPPWWAPVLWTGDGDFTTPRAERQCRSCGSRGVLHPETLRLGPSLAELAELLIDAEL
jgi:hypothetical protein